MCVCVCVCVCMCVFYYLAVIKHLPDISTTY